jgi:glycerol dehydrogenase
MIKKVIFPGCYLQGDGILKELNAIEELKGKRIFILAAKSSATKIIPKHIAEWNLSCDIQYDQFNGTCSWDEINRVCEHLQNQSYDFIAGMGGGSVIDTARVAAMKLGKKFISIPTIAATDAPTASACVVYNNDGIIVDYFTTKNPDYVIVDTRVIAEAPVRFLISGMGDALATRFEAETCDKSLFKNIAGGYNLRSTMAIAALCYNTLLEYGVTAKIACENNIVTHALDYVVEANILLSGVGFESGGLSTAHGIHDCLCNLKETHDYYHGEKVAFGTLAGLFLENKPLVTINEVYTFCESVNLPTKLSDLGLTGLKDKQLHDVISTVLKNKASYIHNVPFTLSAELIFDAIKMADAYGRKRSKQ